MLPLFIFWQTVIESAERFTAHMSANQYTERFCDLYEKVRDASEIIPLKPQMFLKKDTEMYSPLMVGYMALCDAWQPAVKPGHEFSLLEDICKSPLGVHPEHFDFKPLRDACAIAEEVVINGGEFDHDLADQTREALQGYRFYTKQLLDNMREGRASLFDMRFPQTFYNIYGYGEELLDVAEAISTRSFDPNLTIAKLRERLDVSGAEEGLPKSMLNELLAEA